MTEEEAYDILDLTAIKKLQKWVDDGPMRSFTIGYNLFHGQWCVNVSCVKATNFGLTGPNIHSTVHRLFGDSQLAALMT